MKRKARRIIVECKNVETLRPNHIAETIRKYKHPYYPDSYDMIIPRRTRVPDETREFCKERKAKIRRVRL
jgi:hypothetical protein